MYSITQLEGGFRDLDRLRKRVVRSYGMQRIDISQHNRLLQAINAVEDLIEVVKEENDGAATQADTKE